MSDIIINPFRFAPVGYDADAQAMFDARAAVGDEPSAAYKQAISDYIVELKAVSGLWNDIIQLVVMAGATTVAGASVAIKGNSPTSVDHINSDVALKTGVLNDGVTKRWNTGYSGTVAGTGQDDFHTYIYVTELGGNFRPLYGQGGNSTTAWSYITSNQVSARTNFTSVSGDTSSGGYGANRNASSNFEVLRAGATSTITSTSIGVNSGTYLFGARGSNGGSAATGVTGDCRVLIWALGSGVSTLADYNSPTSNLVTALNAI